jgi:acyl carrier protein
MDELNCVVLRDLIQESSGSDPSTVTPDLSLTELGVGGLGLYALIVAIEQRFGIDFPADLVGSLDTVDDLLHFTAVKISQR